MGSDAIIGTDFTFPNQTNIYRGKVRDVYTIKDKYLVAIASDRISAFDVVLPRPIPFKGQILNQTATYFLKATADIVPNWLIDVPDPNVSVGYRCEPFKIEMVVRGMLVGHAWREYETGKREICGEAMPDDMQEYDLFPEPIITPATKAETGHDEDISGTEIIARGLATAEQFEELSAITRKLFVRGQEMAQERGLILADTKYEFGLKDGKIYLIDEIHTPDSSRYFYADSYKAYIDDHSQPTPKHLSKQFVREWLVAGGFNGNAGETVPEMDDEFVASVSERYIELYEQITGQTFVKAESEAAILERIESNVLTALEKLDA